MTVWLVRFTTIFKQNFDNNIAVCYSNLMFHESLTKPPMFFLHCSYWWIPNFFYSIFFPIYMQEVIVMAFTANKCCCCCCCCFCRPKYQCSGRPYLPKILCLVSKCVLEAQYLNSQPSALKFSSSWALIFAIFLGFTILFKLWSFTLLNIIKWCKMQLNWRQTILFIINPNVTI